MNFLYPEEWPQFFTSTVHEWKHLLKENQYKNIIIRSLQFLKEHKRVEIYGYVIMSNHVHFIWQKRDPLSIELFTPCVFIQKLNYIHYNPVRVGLCKYPEEFKYSSARFYQKEIDEFNFTEHWAG